MQILSNTRNATRRNGSTSDVFGKVTPVDAVDDIDTDCDQQHTEHRSALLNRF